MRLLVFAFLSCNVLLAQKYDVSLSPPSHAGDLAMASFNGSKFQQISVAGQVVKHEEFSVEFEARAEVLEVDRKGEAFRIAFTVSSLTKSESGNATDLLEPGSVVLVDGSASDPISLKDGHMSDAVHNALELVCMPHKPGGATDHEVFGSKQPKAIGESWSINSKLGAEDLKREGVQIPPERLLGKTELLGKDKVGDIDCLNVRAELKGDGFTVQDPNSGLVMEGRMHATFDGCVPLTGTSVRKGMELELNFQGTIPSNGAKVDLVERQKSSATWTDVQK